MCFQKKGWSRRQGQKNGQERRGATNRGEQRRRMAQDPPTAGISLYANFYKLIFKQNILIYK